VAQIDWAYIYRPRVQIGSVAYDMPLPIATTNERFTNDMKQVKVPLQNGVILSGVSRGALQVSFDGLISRNTISGVLHQKDAMMDLFLNSGGVPFTFYRYYDATRDNYRWYEECVCNSLAFTPVHNQVYTMAYSLQITVPSGKENVLITAVGEAPSVIDGNLSGRIYDGQVQGDDKLAFVENLDQLPEDRTLLYGPLLIKLPDTDGTSAVYVQDGDGNIIFKIDSSGRVKSISPISLARSIAVEE